MGKYEKIRDAEPYHSPPEPQHYFDGDERSPEAKAFIEDILAVCRKHGFALRTDNAWEGIWMARVTDDSVLLDIQNAAEYRR